MTPMGKFVKVFDMEKFDQVLPEFFRLDDPEVRRDGLCAECGKKRVRPEKTYATPEQYAKDPFCSRVCAERWHTAVREAVQVEA